ncbi:MAG: hypothetical protein QF733_02185 [Phycisphaerales bacterium]|nr:hypothetical protein [Phycisphaerales bacterium]
MPHLIRSLGWSFYAASSWTWCIGLFLPTILMQWFGWTGFLLIAIPNCVGAAAMGLLLGSPGASRRFCRRHPAAIAAFIDVTIAFHLFFLFMAGLWLAPEGGDLPAAGVLWSVAIAYGVSWIPRKFWPLMGTAAFGVGAFVVLEWGHMLAEPAWTGQRSLWHAAWFLPVFAIGFLICPWLDGPFHRARQEVRGPWTSLLLGPLFLCMLLVTATYWWIGDGNAPEIVLVWMFGQSIFTMAANFKERRTLPGVHTGYPAGGRALITAAILVAACIPAATSRDLALDAYISLLAAYGIAFPAVVLGWCLPRSPRISADAAARFTILLIAAGGLGTVGFLTGPAWVAVPAAGLVLTAPWVAGRRGPA